MMQRKSIKDIKPNAYKAMLGMEQYTLVREATWHWPLSLPEIR